MRTRRLTGPSSAGTRRRRTTGLLLLAVLSIVTALAVARGQAAGDPTLVTAAKDGDLSTVRALIARRVNVNEPARDGSTALLWAAYASNLDMAKALIAAGANVNTPNRYGITPLLQAARVGDASLIAALLKAGATLAVTHPEGETALMSASRAGRVDAVKLLVEAGADLNSSDAYQEQTALMWAASEGHRDVVEALLNAGADPNRRAHVTTQQDRRHADHPTGGFTALMFAVRNGHEDVARALVKGGADPKQTNGDGVTATIVAIVNDRLDLARTLVDLGADPNDGALYFAVDMHDATTDMRARDGSRLRADHPNTLTSMDLIKLLLDRGADPNKAFVGQLHNYTLCCSDEINASPFYRAAIASDIDVMKLLIAKGAKVDWSPVAVNREGGRGGGGGRGMNGNVGKTPVMMAMVGGRGAPFGGGPGFERLGPPPYREPGTRDPLEATKLLLSAGADPNVKAPDGSTPLHQAVTARQVAIIRALVSAGAKLDATNKDNLTPLLLAEKPEKNDKDAQAANTDPNRFQVHRDSREDVIAALRELMGLGPNDPAPVPPPDPNKKDDKDDKKSDDDAAAQGAQ
jgi:ankyrin repeat protein